jgi:membrane protease YdiL (CAAX protease family)
MFLAFVILAIWAVITVAGGRLMTAGGAPSLLSVVSDGVGWPFLAAALFGLASVLALGWHDAGLGPVRNWHSLGALWLPLVYIAGFAGFAANLGLPPAGMIGIILVNCLLVGLSEEVMFRGIILGAMRARFGLWPAVLGSTLIFGAAHSLNVVLIGALAAALAQSAAAFISGLMFCAIRLRTGSLWPCVVVHGLWNAATFVLLAALGTSAAGGVPQGGPAALAYLVPLLLVLPNGIYAIWLIRRLPQGA